MRPPRQPLRLALVRQRHAGFGGAERMITTALARLKQTQDIDVSIVARSWPAHALSGASLVRCAPFYLGRTMRDVGFARAASSLCTRFDLVQAHERVPGAQIFRAGSGVHAEWLLQRARQLGAADASSLAAEGYHRAVLSLESQMLSHPSLRAVIANSEMVARDLARHHPACTPLLRVIWNGIDRARVSPEQRRAQRPPARRALGIGEANRAVAMVGSDWQRKGAACLLTSLAQLPKDIILLLAGKESKPGRLRAIARKLDVDDRVRWIGPTEDPMAVLAAADCFALPSIYDQCPSASIEALACGLPVVLSSQCGTHSLVHPGQTGFVVDAHDHAAWPAAIARALELPATAADDASASVRHLDVDGMVEAWVELYRTLREENL